MDWLLYMMAFAAGFVDAIAGGGGMIQLPALMIVRPDLPIPTLLGINKLSSFIGTSGALARYAHGVRIQWNLILPSAVIAFFFSMAGAQLVMKVNSEILRPLVIVLLVGVFIYSLLRERLKRRTQSQPSISKAIVWGSLMGFYDGFFGPGTGGFLIFGFVSLLGMTFLKASASAKVVNWATNLAALLAFAWSGHLDYRLGLMMGAFNLVGGITGSHLAIKKGDRLVERAFQILILAVIARLLWDFFKA